MKIDKNKVLKVINELEEFFKDYDRYNDKLVDLKDFRFIDSKKNVENMIYQSKSMPTSELSVKNLNILHQYKTSIINKDLEFYEDKVKKRNEETMKTGPWTKEINEYIKYFNSIKDSIPESLQLNKSGYITDVRRYIKCMVDSARNYNGINDIYLYHLRVLKERLENND